MKAKHEFKTIVEYKEYLRIYFAAMALQGMMANNAKDTIEVFAKVSVEIADALINALNQKP